MVIDRECDKRFNNQNLITATRIWCSSCELERIEPVNIHGLPYKQFSAFKRAQVCNECNESQFLEFLPIHKDENIGDVFNETLREHWRQKNARQDANVSALRMKHEVSLQTEEAIKQKVTTDDIKFVIDTICKEAEYDRISVKQIVYGMFSAATKTGIPHNLNSKDAGAGKSYLLNKCADYFPEKYVIILAGASSKAFLHRQGIMVIKNTDTSELLPAEPLIRKLQVEKEELQGIDPKQGETKERIEEIKSEIENIIGLQQKLIDLSCKIIIIQDTPQDGLFDALMSIISQDSEKDQEYIFTDKSSTGKLGTKSNIIRGPFVMFTTRVIDDSKNQRFEEKNRRFVNVTPNVSAEKIKAANRLTSKRYGLLPEEYDSEVVSIEDKKKSKIIVAAMFEKLRDHSKYLKAKEPGIKILFESAIAGAMPYESPWSMTVAERLLRYLAIITKVHMDDRPRLVNKKTGAFYPISTFDDLKEALELMERGASNLRSYLAECYNQVILPEFIALDGKCKEVQVDGTLLEKEAHVGLTTEDIAQSIHKRLNLPTPGIREVREKYLYPLVNHGLINYERSLLNKNENIWFPVDDKVTAFSLFTGGDFRLVISDPALYPSKNVLELIFRSFVKQEVECGLEKNKTLLDYYLLVEADGAEISPNELLEKYFSNPESCFKKDYSTEYEPRVNQNILGSNQILRNHLQAIEANRNDVLRFPPELPICNENDIEKSSSGNISLSDPATMETCPTCYIKLEPFYMRIHNCDLGTQSTIKLI